MPPLPDTLKYSEIHSCINFKDGSQFLAKMTDSIFDVRQCFFASFFFVLFQDNKP